MANFEEIQTRIVRIPESGCWIWMGATNRGYGTTSYLGKQRGVHRIIYEALVGIVPKGLELDHLCRVRCCCNPYHLEAVTHSVNVKRGTAWYHVIERNKNATHCKNGHERTLANTYFRKNGTRRCKLCIKDRNKS